MALFCIVIGQATSPGSGTQLADGICHRSVSVTKSVCRTQVASARQLEAPPFKSFDDATGPAPIPERPLSYGHGAAPHIQEFQNEA